MNYQNYWRDAMDNVESNKKESPIVYRNIYYILMYAINEMRHIKLRDIDNEDFKALNDLYASIINTSMQFVLDSGVLQEYNRIGDTSASPRGKLDVASSIADGCYRQGKIKCNYFRLDVDTEVNRVIRLAMRILLVNCKDISKENISNLKIVDSYMSKVTMITPREVDFREIDTSLLSNEYKTAFYMSKLIIEEYITEDGESGRRIIETEDTDRMNKIFEKFVRNYYKYHYKRRGVNISAKEFDYEGTKNTHYGKYITDTTIENFNDNKILIIDTKWYKDILNKRRQAISENQRQIDLYVMKYGCLEWSLNNKPQITGVLLYAKPKIEVDILALENETKISMLAGYCGIIKTRVIDLEKDFESIKSKLDSIYEEFVK